MSAMGNFRFHFFILALLGLALVLFGKAFGSLPDEIDKDTYYQRYLTAKETSDDRRDEANGALSSVRSKEAQISHHQDEIRSHQDGIAANQQTITNSENEIANHRSQLQRLSVEIPRAEARINSLVEEGRRLQSSESDLRNRLAAENANLQRENARLEQLREDLRQVERAQALAQGELQGKVGQLAQTRTDEANSINERQQLGRELEQLARDRSVLENNLNGLREQNRQQQMALQQQRQIQAQNEARLRQIEQEIAPQKEALERARQAWEASKQELLQAQNQQTTLQQQKQNINNQLAGLDNQDRQIADTLARFPERERGLQARVGELQSKIATLAEEIHQGQASMEPMTEAMKRNAEMLKQLSTGEQTPEVQAKIQALRAENERLQAQLRTLRESLATKRQAFAEANQQLGGTQQEITNLGQERAKLEGQRREIETRRVASRTELQQIERSLVEASNAIARAQQNIVRTQTDVTRAEQNMREGAVRRDSVAREVQASAVRLQQIEADASRAAQSVAQTEARVQEIVRTVAQKEAQSRQMDARLAQLREVIVQLQNQIAELQRQMNQYATAVQRAREQVTSALQRVAQVQQNVQALENERARLLALLEQNDRSRRETETLRAQLLEEQQARQSAIVEFQNVIATSRQNISQFQALIAARQSELAQFQTELRQLQKIFADADQVAKAVEKITAQKLADYQERYNRYQLYLTAARDLGAKQGRPVGSSKAKPLGEAEARRLGELNGLKYGLIAAELDGRWRGLLRGKLVGDETGYADGLHSKTDYDAAYAEGFELGRQAAETQAERTHVPKGYAERMQEIVATVPGTKVVLSNGISKALLINKEAQKINGDETELSPEEIADAKEIVSAINSVIVKLEAEIKRYQDPRQNFYDAHVAYQGAGVIPIDLGGRDCSSVYKKVADYLRACEESYGAAFNQGAAEMHWQVFAQNYPGEWHQRYDANFAKNKNNLFLASKEESRVVVYAEARARGVREIRAKGEEDGQRNGFAETLPGAEERAFARGRAQAQTFANAHALIRLVANNSALIISNDARGPIQGADLALGINLYNAGGGVLAPALGRLAITEKSSNIEMAAQSHELRDLPAQRVIELHDVLSAKINDDAVPGEKFWLKGQVIVPGDGVKSEERLPVVYEGVVKVNPGITTALDFEAKPKWRDWGFWPFTWKYRTHEVEAELTGMRDNVPAGYRVKLSANDAETEALINVVRPELSTNPISRGEKVSVKLAYQFKAKAKKKALKFKLQVFYGEDVVYENVMSLLAH